MEGKKINGGRLKFIYFCCIDAFFVFFLEKNNEEHFFMYFLLIYCVIGLDFGFTLRNGDLLFRKTSPFLSNDTLKRAGTAQGGRTRQSRVSRPRVAGNFLIDLAGRAPDYPD